MPATLQTLADKFGCELHGDGSYVVERVATLGSAGPEAISFLANPKFVPQLPNTRAGAVILAPQYVADCPTNCLIASNPYATYARVAAALHPPPAVRPGTHASAVVDAHADIDPSAGVGPLAVIEAGVVVGARVHVGGGSVIGPQVHIGADTRIGANVTIGARVRIGARCIVHPGAVIGADGFGFAQEDGVSIKIPQIGSVWIGDDVEVGANTTIDRGTIEDTVIGNGVKLDNLVQIAHNVHIGEHSLMAAMSGAAGSSIIGKRCLIGGGAVLIDHLTLCDDVRVLFRSVVTRSIRTPSTWSGSFPAEEARRWRRNVARFRQLGRRAERARKPDPETGGGE
ncbi:MAG: UDP-3-O-(3-hydroxymyristoyl)glucosamine N-acyltransferase [Gammaproteobacteria bacterium]|jgi:UDP-3-O-[3-hydroxymyristoyl] glucosamine N-acyltransferase